MKIDNRWGRGILFYILLQIVPILANAGSCRSKLFTVTIDSKLSIGDAIENLADTCDLTVVVKDSWAKRKLLEKLYFVKLKNVTLKGFLDTVLSDNNIHYTLEGNKLMISYLTTRTFRVHYISGQRSGKSRSNVIISESSNSAAGAAGSSGGGGSETGMSIENSDEFTFWSTVSDDIQKVLSGVADDGMHYTKAGAAWIGPDGTKWEYNPLLPIVNPAAGMITVTGTDKQLKRVAKYIETLKKQLKTQVLIDVRILTVTFDDSTTTGVDWNQLYKLQNFTINAYAMGRKNVTDFTSSDAGIVPSGYETGAEPTTASIADVSGSATVSDVVKFLATQGDVKAISSPRVMTLNNQPAMISVGKELYYKIKSSTVLSGSTATGGAAQGESVGSVFAGVLLDITPEIGKNDMITLKINPSITDTLDPVSSQASARDIPPDMIKRQLSSVIKVKDGHHAILGGLITSQSGTKVDKIPLLGDLPLFEYAFKKEEKIKTVIELVIIVTPHIVDNSKDMSLRDLGYKRVNAK